MKGLHITGKDLSCTEQQNALLRSSELVPMVASRRHHTVVGY